MFMCKDLFEFDLDPIENFLRLHEEYKKNPVIDPTVMTLSTVDELGKPNSRVVLLKQVEKGDFIFFTNYESTKGQELSKNPNACLNFFWPNLALQIKVLGTVVKTTRKENEDYFKTRPRVSQIGAWASNQSQIIESYQVLQDKMNRVTEDYNNREVPCPSHWGGYRLVPTDLEFWFGMEGRLHYRYIYEKSGEQWLRSMKSP